MTTEFGLISLEDARNRLRGNPFQQSEVSTLQASDAPLKTAEKVNPSTQDLLNALPYAAVIIDEEGDFGPTNTTFKELSSETEKFMAIAEALTYPTQLTQNGTMSMIEAAEINQLRSETEICAEGTFFRIRVCPQKAGSQTHALVLIEDITENKKREDQIRADVEEQISMVRHDLKQPLTGIKGFTELVQLTLEANPPDITKAITHLQRVRKLSDRMLSRIDLDLNAVRSLDTLELQNINLIDFMTGAVTSIRDLLPQAVTLNDKIPDEVIEINADPHALMTVLSNLVDNAVKYMQKEGDINIWIESQGQEATIFVNDTGPGIPSELWEKIFEKWFTQESNQVRGTGLGLASCKKIMEAHGGDIKVFASEVGKGTTMAVILPTQPTK